LLHSGTQATTRKRGWWFSISGPNRFHLLFFR